MSDLLAAISRAEWMVMECRKLSAGGSAAVQKHLRESQVSLQQAAHLEITRRSDKLLKRGDPDQTELL